MARVTRVKAARKKQPNCRSCHVEINVGDSYKWFANRIGRSSTRKVFCATCQIRPSDMTTSGNLQTLYLALEGAEDDLGKLTDFTEVGDLGSILESAAEGVREAAGMYEESADNMESGFGHETYQSQEIREKQEMLEQFADEIDDAASDLEDFDEDAARKEAEEEVRGENDLSDTADLSAFEGEVEDKVETARDDWRTEQMEKAENVLANNPL